jgi:glycosyltransferase involved in cell wall biosynthesis
VETNRYDSNWADARALPAESLTLVYAGSPGKKELFPEIIEGVQRSRRRGIDVSFKVVGVTEDELSAIMRRRKSQERDFDGITCYGRMSRAAALQIVAASDYTVILRPQKRFANAGFPSKFVESLSLGVPVIANATSDIAEYLRDGQEGYLLSEPTAEALEGAIVCASALTIEQKSQMRAQARLRARECFDYRNYAEALSKFLLSARPCS